MTGNMTRYKTPHAAPGPQSGSVIVWILVCIAMFAALGFAVSNMMRGGGSGASEELTRVAASDIMAYSEGVRRGVQGLRAGSGITLGEISFETPHTGTAYQNPSCTGEECRVFSPRGGGVTYAAPRAEWIDNTLSGQPYYGEWYFAGDTCVANVGTGGTDCLDNSPGTNDLTVFLPYIRKNICIEINRQLGIGEPAEDPPQNSGCPWNTTTAQRYTGSFATGGTVQAGAAFLGRQSGCFRMGSCGSLESNSYHYYQVLVPR